MHRRALLYAAAIFLSSSLLFLVEPMAGKRLLPLLGGSAAVWTTCLVFFQTALLLGYLCAHGIATRLRPRGQALAYALLLVISLAQVAINLNPHPHASTARPIFSVLAVLSGLIGVPFLVLSATSSLLQAWYARSGPGEARMAEAARPPYRLFAVSNFGSLLALVIYPILIEPNFSLRVQTLWWSAGFLLFAIVCGGISFGASASAEPRVESISAARAGQDGDGTPAASETAPQSPPSPAQAVEKPVTAGDRLLWLLMAAGGSLLLCALTTHLSQNIAAIPLLWIVPLTIYLLTFVIAFNGKLYWRWVIVCLLPFALGCVGYLIVFADSDKYFPIWNAVKNIPLWASVLVFCLALFIACLLCHGELYRLRPAPRYTTQYYLLIATGGALGSMFVGVCAPFIFRGGFEMAWSLVYTAALAAVLLWRSHWTWTLFWAIVTAAMVVVVVKQVRDYEENAIVEIRSFYGSMRVLQEITEEGETYRTLVHGTIQHGTQYYGSEDDRTSPTTYYVHNSGIGLALDYCCKNRPRRAGFIGLGAGTLASYGKPGDVFRIYEIDPRVEDIAKNFFTYLRESKAKIELVEGDARLSMEAETPQQYDVIAVDAFSGDAIPVHLLTAEAVQLYQRHLRPGGILAFHVSNSYLELGPVVAQEAEHAGLAAVMISTSDDEYGGYAADWVLVTSNQDFLASAKVKAASAKIELKPGLRLWTDDYSSLWPIIKWHKRKDEQE